MRNFLLERIEKVGSHFNDFQKGQLRLMVSRLKEARLVATVRFKINSSAVSELEAGKLAKNLNDPDIKQLLEDEDCQLVVVGYADMSGSQAHNIKLSKMRARAVDLVISEEIGRRADMSGDYGPTDVISEDASENRVVEVYAGTIEMSGKLRETADQFKENFQRFHGLR